MDDMAFGRIDRQALGTIWGAMGGDAALTGKVTLDGSGELPSAFAVSDLAAASVGAAGLAIAELVGARTGTTPALRVDRRLASFWFRWSIFPIGWTIPEPWDPIAGDYATSDGWIRLHTNAPHHREAALAALGVANDKAAVTAAVARWQADAFETAVVAAGGCAATMRDLPAWAAHEQGRAVAAEPLVWHDAGMPAPAERLVATPDRPLAGVRVLDLTRVLAGPVATRFLAGFGADVLRIDPPDWDEPAVVPSVTLGKRCARLDLREAAGMATLKALLSRADILVHGYRGDALDRLGLNAETRAALRPGLIDVCLDAYGWTGPWRHRRGFDSLVQMSSGIAAAGMAHEGADRPRPLPVQALDHATGYLMATAAIRGLTKRLASGMGARARTSLARTAALLTSLPRPPSAAPFADRADADCSATPEQTGWGPAQRLLPPLAIDGAAMRWDRGASALGSAEARWEAG